MSIKLASNFFQITCDPKEELFVYEIQFQPALSEFPRSFRSMIEKRLNAKLDKLFPFFVKGCYLYSMKKAVRVFVIYLLSILG